MNDSYKTRFRKFNNNQARLILFLVEMLYRDGQEEKYSDALRIDRFSLEHLIPQKWQASWYSVDSYDETGMVIDRNKPEEFSLNRNRAVKSLGNMALLTTKLNTSISNADMETKMKGKATGINNGGIKKYASSLVTTKMVIDEYDVNKEWDERSVYKYEKIYFDKLNAFYGFC